MRGRSKYTAEQNSQLKVAAMEVLAESQEYMTIEQICHANLTLVGVTTQKMARILNEMAEQGVIIKSKLKSSSKMTYKIFNGER